MQLPNPSEVDERVASGVGSPASLRSANRQRVLDLLRTTGSVSQSEIARRTGLSRATVSNIVRELRESDWITVRALPAAVGNDTGRRGTGIVLNQRAGLVLALDFGHNVLQEDHRELPADHGAEEDLPLAAEVVDSLLIAVGAPRSAVLGIGMGLAGPVDPVTGEVRSPAILPGWVGVPAKAAMSDHLGLPVLVDNDANLGALGELTWGAGVGARHLLYIKASYGVGAGLILDGRLYGGSGGIAGEIGHVTVDDRGALCQCGDRGCLETLAGSEALLSLLRRSYGANLTITDAIAKAVGGDSGCRRIIADAGRAIGIAVAAACSLLAPERVVIGGTLAAAGAILLAPMRDVVRRHAMHTIPDNAQIVAGALGERAEVLGGLALALRSADRLAAQPKVPLVPI
ncbi:MAG: ROK family transcriptional regulator [Frankiaceae bacterium]